MAGLAASASPRRVARARETIKQSFIYSVGLLNQKYKMTFDLFKMKTYDCTLAVKVTEINLVGLKWGHGH